MQVAHAGEEPMVQYLVLIYEDEESWETLEPEQAREIRRGHMEFMQRHRNAVLGGNALQPTLTATTIRVPGTSASTVTDGAFSETKEALGGYYLIEAADLDEALAIANEVPARFGGVEVRPVKSVS